MTFVASYSVKATSLLLGFIVQPKTIRWTCITKIFHSVSYVARGVVAYTGESDLPNPTQNVAEGDEQAKKIVVHHTSYSNETICINSAEDVF